MCFEYPDTTRSVIGFVECGLWKGMDSRVDKNYGIVTLNIQVEKEISYCIQRDLLLESKGVRHHVQIGG